MKKLIFRVSYLALLLITIVFYSCKEVELIVNDNANSNPDFKITNVDYAFNNESLNSESTILFLVSYKNNEETKNRYQSILNFYVDSLLIQSSFLENISKKDTMKVFKWKAYPGNHTFKFAINIAENKSLIVDEKNITNNTMEKDLNIPIKELIFIKTENINISTIANIISEDTVSGVNNVLNIKQSKISDKTIPTKTTYENYVSTYVAAIEKNDGTIDSSKYFISIRFQDNKSTPYVSNAIVEINKMSNEVYIYDENSKIIFRQNGATVVNMVRPSYIRYNNKMGSCGEPWFWSCAGLGIGVAACILSIAASETGIGVAAAIASCGASAAAGYECYNALVDNPPTMTVNYTRDGTICHRCIDDKRAEEFYYLDVHLIFNDDRGGVTSNTNHILGGCSPYSSQVEATDCGGNTIKETHSTPFVQYRNYLDKTCHKGGSGHN
jgi:hypothetical protein